jgi:Family of unknown function (DUF5343)
MVSLPYLSSPGNITRALTAIKSAAVPERVSQDFVKTILKIPGGSGDQMTAFLKKLALTNADGTPSDLYKRFRNSTFSGSAIATAIRSAYAPLYVRNEFMHELDDAQLLGLIVEETGEAHDSNTAKLTLSCIKQLKAFADFRPATDSSSQLSRIEQPERQAPSTPIDAPKREIDFRLGYTINLNLPTTSDAAVFDAIFKSLRENLLREDDA